MKNRLTQRILSLLLTFALVLSMAGSALAAEQDVEGVDDDQLVIAEEEYAPDAAPVSEEEEEIIPEEPETPEPETPAETEEPVEDETVDAADVDGGWTVERDEATGECEFSFVYEENGETVNAADGYYSIPEATDVQVDGKSYTFCAGIYAFDEDGACKQELGEANVNVEVSKLTEEDGIYTVSHTASLEVALGDVSCEDKIVSSDVELFTGVEELSGLYHSFTKGVDNGCYSGSFMNTSLNAVCYATNGKPLTTTGSYHWYQSALYYFKSTKDGLAVGTCFTGTHKFSSPLPASLASTYDTGVVYYLQGGKGVEDDGGYHWYNGKLYQFGGSDTQKGGISVGTAYSGYHYCATLPAGLTGYTAKRWYNFKNGTGTILNGYVSSKRTYYNKGVVSTSLTGWKTIGKYTYYFNKGVACSGWNSLKRNGKTYKYYFRSDGSLVEDLYAYFGKSYYSKKQRIYVNRYSNNITIYQYNTETKDYDIPLKTMVCSTSKSMNLKYGTYKISQLGRWYHKGKWYWQYLTYIGGTGALFHSCRYYSKNIRTMQVSNYNSMGKCNTDKCVRVAVGTARLIYNLVGSQAKGAVTCKYYYSKDYGPFGHVTIANTTGKLSGTKAKDPTE